MTKTISGALDTHLSGETTTLATCWKITRTDATVLGFTDHDVDLIVDGVTYTAATGYTPTDVQTSHGLAVDNLDIKGILSSPAITEEDLNAGLWDHADIIVFMVNWADLTQGIMYQRVGKLGEVTNARGMFTAEMRGLTDAYNTTICELYSPSCRADLGDARCQVDLGPFTVTGSIDSVNPDNITVYDAARTEPGPTGGIAITGVTNADPCVITATAHGFTELQLVTLSEIVGPVALNAVVRVYNPTANTFDIGIDTTDTGDFPAYVSGGLASPMGADAGYFDFGVLTFTSGANNGLSMEVRSYVEGQITLALPMPYLIVAGDTYSMHAGCDKAFETCRDRFDNVLNFRGEPYLPGLDKMIQVGRRT